MLCLQKDGFATENGMEAKTLTYRQGFLSVLRLLGQYGDGNGLRSQEKLSALANWAEAPSVAEDHRLRSMGYTDGIVDAVLWLQGELNETPNEKDF